jgi:hypothetical protein
MIVIDPSETPSERSPLKTGEMNPTTPLASGRAPPPSYAAAAAEPVPAPVHSYQSVPVHHQRYVQQPPRGEPFKRFLKAFLVAVIVLVLWGAFLDSVDMAIGTSATRHGQGLRRVGRFYFGVSISDNFLKRWIIHDWYASSTSGRSSPSPPVPCTRLDRVTPAMPGRVLPIQYPPIVEASKSSPLPIEYPSVLPKGEVEVLQHPPFLPKAQVKASDPFPAAIRNPNST